MSKNVFRQILIRTNMYVTVKTHMEESKLIFYMLSKIWGFFMGYFFHFWNEMLLWVSFCQVFNVLYSKMKNCSHFWESKKLWSMGRIVPKTCMETSNMSKGVLGTLQSLYNSSSFRTSHSDIQNDVRWNTFALKIFNAHGHYYFV